MDIRKERTTQVKMNEVIGEVGWVMVFSASVNVISALIWLSVLLVEEDGENHRPVVCH